MRTKQIRIIKKSKCIYEINGVKVDIRKTTRLPKYKGVRQALTLYYSHRNPRVKLIQIDRFVCNLMNKRGSWELWKAIESGEVWV